MRVEVVGRRRAARDRAVDDLEAALLETGGDLLHRRGRGRVEVGDERRGAGAAGSGRDVPGDRGRLPGRHDREHDPGGADHVVQAASTSSPAAVASRRVRSLRPASVVTTRAPPAAYAAPTALPIAPAPTSPIVTTMPGR